MHFSLVSHPHGPMPSVSGIDCTVARVDHGDGMAQIALSYVLAGDIGAIRLPPQLSAARADGLWRTTCFELFLTVGSDPRYLEFNFSTSSRWAAYRFEGYRAAMEPLETAAPARFDLRLTPRMLELGTVMTFRPPDPEWLGADWHIGLSAVVETHDSGTSWWALAHPDGDKPDFHARDCFTGRLEAPRPA